MTSDDQTFDLKNERCTFVMICVELSNAACCVSLRGPGAELEGGGGVQTRPPGPARVAPSTGPARVKSLSELLKKFGTLISI